MILIRPQGMTASIMALMLLICYCCLGLPMAACIDNSTAASQADLQTSSPEGRGQELSTNESVADQDADLFLLRGSWQKIQDLPRGINALAVDPLQQMIYAGTGEQGSGCGVYSSEDGGLSWKISSEGLPVEDVSAVAVDPVSPANVYALSGVQGEIYASPDRGKSWSLRGKTGFITGFDSTLIADPIVGTTLFMISKPGGLAKSSNAGRSWQHIQNGLPKDKNEQTGAYVLSLAVDPTDSSRIYAGTGGFVGQGHGVYKSLDGGMTWSAANRGMLDYRIVALAIDPLHTQTIYAGSDSGELFKSTDGAESWSDAADREVFRQNSYDPDIQSIVLDPVHPDTIYVLVDYIGVVVSEDGGESWTVLGKPEVLESPTFTAMAVTFQSQPAIIVGVNPYIDDSGGWRYSISGESK